MNVFLKILQWLHFRQNLLNDVCVTTQNLIQRERRKLMPCLQIEILAKWKSCQIITLDDVIQFGILLFQPHHTRSCENDSQLGKHIIAFAEFGTPIRLFKHLVDQQHPASIFDKIPSKIGNAAPLEIEIIHIHIEALAIIGSEPFFGILQDKSGLPNATRAFNTDQPIIPIDFIHQLSPDRCTGVINQVRVCAKESILHILFILLFLIHAKLLLILKFATCGLQNIHELCFFASLLMIKRRSESVRSLRITISF